MKDQIRNPFKELKKTDWSKKSNERIVSLNSNNNDSNKSNSNIDNLNPASNLKFTSKPNKSKFENKEKLKEEKKKIERIAKSFKIYPSKIGKDFDKRVNKLQVHFDDLDFDKDYIDSGKYIMFIMALAEKYHLYELYEEVNLEGELNISKEKLKKFFQKYS